MALLEPIFDALNRAHVRYVIVGGLATVLHGYTRFTHDIDLAIDLVPAEAQKAIDVLTALGFQPNVPVAATQFADPQARLRWLREKNMTVFPLWDPRNPLRVIDLFVENPIPFDDLWREADEIPLETTRVRVASIDHLIQMKRLAGRARDLDDIAALELIRRERMK